MIGSRVFVIKERDEWSNFAEFVGAMVAKYADKMDFESLPDPDVKIAFLGKPRRKQRELLMKP